MTYPTPAARGGMPTWAKWTMAGCGGCLTVSILGLAGCGAWFWQVFGKNMKFEMLDVSGKADLPITAKAGQLLPLHVGAFVRKSVSRGASSYSASAPPSALQGSYVANGKRVELIVMSTAEARKARAQRSPFGDAMRRQNQSQNPNQGFHMSMKFGDKPLDMVVWSKRNWTVMVSSPDMVAAPFAKVYQPLLHPAK